MSAKRVRAGIAERCDRAAKMAKTDTVEEVLRDGEVLVLNGGRRLIIDDPDDATMASIWLPPARVTLRGRSGERLRVTNVETVAARFKVT